MSYSHTTIGLPFKFKAGHLWREKNLLFWEHKRAYCTRISSHLLWNSNTCSKWRWHCIRVFIENSHGTRTIIISEIINKLILNTKLAVVGKPNNTTQYNRAYWVPSTLEDWSFYKNGNLMHLNHVKNRNHMKTHEWRMYLSPCEMDHTAI